MVINFALKKFTQYSDQFLYHFAAGTPVNIPPKIALLAKTKKIYKTENTNIVKSFILPNIIFLLRNIYFIFTF
jgi:hypothetical protein